MEKKNETYVLKKGAGRPMPKTVPHILEKGENIHESETEELGIGVSDDAAASISPPSG